MKKIRSWPFTKNIKLCKKNRYPDAVLSPQAHACLQKLQNVMLARQYAQSSIRNYAMEMRLLFSHYQNVTPSSITQQDIINYLCFVIKEHHVGREKCHQVAQACSFYFKHVYPTAFIIPSAFYPRKQYKLPQVFSVAQIQQLLSVITNQKHLMMVSLFYGTGLRLNEMRNLKLTDIDSEKYQVKVVAGKGGKDRFTILPRHLLEPLRNYYRTCKPAVYLFEGQRRGMPMCNESIQHFLRINIAKIGLKGRGYTTHTLRHSFATHLLENGTNIHTIKELLGHTNLATTMVYLHLQHTTRMSIVSPFDALIQPPI